jgi:hypothetical protein
MKEEDQLKMFCTYGVITPQGEDDDGLIWVMERKSSE